MPAFERYRPDYLDDAAFGELQQVLMKNPEAEEVAEFRRRIGIELARRLKPLFPWKTTGMRKGAGLLPVVIGTTQPFVPRRIMTWLPDGRIVTKPKRSSAQVLKCSSAQVLKRFDDRRPGSSWQLRHSPED